MANGSPLPIGKAILAHMAPAAFGVAVRALGFGPKGGDKSDDATKHNGLNNLRYGSNQALTLTL
jgi:hypothetical protein